MIFENLWPLLFLAAIPFIILLYLLKPKGKDTQVSSNLLWKKILINEQSQTFLEKFVHNLLMYLQIAILLLLVISFMSPFILKNDTKKTRQILLLDTSASMQMQTQSGKTRFEEAIAKTISYIKSSDNITMTIITCDSSGNNLLAIENTDKNALIEMLKNITCGDCSDNMAAAKDMVVQIANSNETDQASLIICTDANNASVIENFPEIPSKELWVMGDAANNISNNYLVFSLKDNGKYDMIVNLTNYANCAASCELTLFDEDEKVLAVNRISMDSFESSSFLFKDIDWKGNTCSASISSFQFEDKKNDALKSDNTSYGIKNKSGNTSALLLGKGNKFLENAYAAITGNLLTKSDAPSNNEDYGFFIYDTDYTNITHDKNALIIGCREYSNATLENVVLNVENCDLAYGLENFTLGVNSTKTYDLPEWGTSFLETDGKCVGFYGENNGIKEVVLGFDLRETDLVLRPEFPILLANTINYLTDNSAMAANSYFAGDSLLIEPWAEIDLSTLPSVLDKAGLYEINIDDAKEFYTVRLRTDTESNGTIEANSIQDNSNLNVQKVKKTLKNFFLILTLIFLIIEWIIYIKRKRYKGIFYKVIRACVFLLLLLVLFDVKIPLHSNMTSTIFLADLSNSNSSHQNEMINYLNNTISDMPSHNQYGIICFGKDTSVEQFLTKDNHFTGLMSLPQKSATNFENAVSKALTMLPKDTNNRLVLLTDGKQTIGEIQNLSPLILSSDVELLSILYETEEKNDAYIENVTLPSYLHPNESYSISISVDSNYETDADLLLYYGSELTETYQVHLNRGSNKFSFHQQVTDDTLEMLQVELKAKNDSCEENNVYNAYAIIEDNPKILVITSSNFDKSAFLPVLNSISCDYSTVYAANAPRDINSMLKYKSIILANVFIDDLPVEFLENLETYVKDYGGGFICCGGDNSFALGGYRNTPIETVLPVNMNIRNINENPSMTMVMIIDRSGSMTSGGDGEGDKLDLAIRASMVAVDNLSDKDRVGVLTFDDDYNWQVEITSASEREKIKKKITEIPTGGGTTIKPAVKEAFDKISQEKTSIKHVILLTDGQGETSDYSDIINKYKYSGITLSTVAVGDDADTELLEKLAKECGGRYYLSTLSSDLPRIFAQEVFLGSDSYIQEKEVALNVLSGHEITKNLFTNGWPHIYGYIASSPKLASRMLISSEDKDNPILTIWQYGLGHTVAWNSDITGQWSGSFSGQEDYAHLWKRLIDYSVGNSNLGEDNVNIKTVNNHSTITYSAKEYNEETKIIATMINPKGESKEVNLHATSPGTYETDVETDLTGLYHFNIRREDADQITNYTTSACAVQFSDEYKYNISTKPFLSFMDKHGRIITEKDDVWKKISQNKQEKFPIANILLAVSILLFLLDVAFRRLEITPGHKKKKEKQTYTTVNSAHKNENISINTKNEKTTVAGNNDTDKKQKEKNNVKNPSKNTKKQKQEQETLDTSALLKKKDDRNMK